MTWMPTWQHFLEGALGLVLRVGMDKKLVSILITSLANIFAYNNQEPTLMINNHILMLS